MLRSIIVAPQQRAVWRLTASRASSSMMSATHVQCANRNATETFRHQLQQDESVRDALAYCLSFSNDETDFNQNFCQLNDLMRSQIQFNQNQQFPRQQPQTATATTTTNIDNTPLPTLLSDALKPNKHQAIVVTEAKKPFSIVDVNQAWQDLCEYSYLESRGHTLGSLIAGPDTDRTAATGLIAKLLQGEPCAGVTLVNYTKTGRRFVNRVRVGPLRDPNTQKVTHFVGVLQEVPLPQNLECV